MGKSERPPPKDILRRGTEYSPFNGVSGWFCGWIAGRARGIRGCGERKKKFPTTTRYISLNQALKNALLSDNVHW
jgi:hypothetical protein